MLITIGGTSGTLPERTDDRYLSGTIPCGGPIPGICRVNLRWGAHSLQYIRSPWFSGGQPRPLGCVNTHLDTRFGAKPCGHARQVGVWSGRDREEAAHRGCELLVAGQLSVFQGREDAAAGVVEDLDAQVG